MQNTDLNAYKQNNALSSESFDKILKSCDELTSVSISECSYVVLEYVTRTLFLWFFTLPLSQMLQYVTLPNKTINKKQKFN